MGPYLRFQHYAFTNTDNLYSPNSPYLLVDKTQLTTFGGGGVFGWKGLIGSHFCLEPFLGVGYAAGQVEDLTPNNGYSVVIENGIRGLEVRLGFNVGYVFGKAAE